jgi:hypothetical protein
MKCVQKEQLHLPSSWNLALIFWKFVLIPFQSDIWSFRATISLKRVSLPVVIITPIHRSKYLYYPIFQYRGFSAFVGSSPLLQACDATVWLTIIPVVIISQSPTRPTPRNPERSVSAWQRRTPAILLPARCSPRARPARSPSLCPAFSHSPPSRPRHSHLSTRRASRDTPPP